MSDWQVPRDIELEHARAAEAEGWKDSAMSAVYAFWRYNEARTPLDNATWLINLGNALSDLQTWLPGFDAETGTMPWARGEDG